MPIGKPPISDLPPSILCVLYLFFYFNMFLDILAMFTPRPVHQFFQHNEEKFPPKFTGVGVLVNEFEKDAPPLKPIFEPPIIQKKRLREEKFTQNQQQLELTVSQWDPHNNPKATRYRNS